MPRIFCHDRPFRRTSRRRAALGLAGPLIAAAAAGLLAPKAAMASLTYTAIDLGSLGLGESYGAGINSSNQVVGFTQGTNNQGFVYSYSSGTTNLIGAAGSFTNATAINDSGVVIGYSLDAGAYSYSNGTMASLGDLGGGYSYAAAINASGAIVGDSQNADYYDHAVQFNDGGTPTDLGTLAGDMDSQALSINSAGQIVGISGVADVSGNITGERAFWYSNGMLTMVGTLGGATSTANAINDNNQIVGFSATSSGNNHAFLFDTGTSAMTDLGTLDGTGTSMAYGLNNLGMVVGTSNDHAFVYTGGSMYDLNAITDVSGLGDYTLFGATGVNDSGYIIANGQGANGSTHAFLLIPDQAAVTPEPGALALLSMGLAAGAPIALRRRRRQQAVAA